ncbi:hypothetical protein PENSPDRAFT_655647 [Peniophora sp. CONT]|nr:hypothetical protein PENSPDRAFT_655647 [Peniophora sp. CONT]
MLPYPSSTRRPRFIEVVETVSLPRRYTPFIQTVRHSRPAEPCRPSCQCSCHPPARVMRILYADVGSWLYDLNTYLKVFSALEGALKGVGALHSIGMLHGDVAPHTILFFEGVHAPQPSAYKATSQENATDGGRERDTEHAKEKEQVDEETVGYGAITDFDA